MAEGLEAAVGVHAVHQAIYRGDRACRLYRGVPSAVLARLSHWPTLSADIRLGFFRAQGDPGTSDRAPAFQSNR